MAEIQKRKRKEYEEYTPAQKAAYQKAFQEAYARELPRQQERMRYDADRNAHIQQVFQTEGRDAARAAAANRVIQEQNNRRMMPSAREIDTKFKEFGRQALSRQRLFDMVKPEQAKERDAQRAAAEREKEARWYEQNAAAYGALDDSGKSAVERANEASDRWDNMQMNMMPGMMDTSGLGMTVQQQMALVDAYKERQAATAALEQAAGENAKAVARYAEQMKNAEYAEAFAKDARQGADEHPVLHNAASVVSNALNLPAALDYGKQWARNTFTDDYAPIDVNTPEQLMGLYRDTVRDETGKNIEESLGGGFGGKAASFVYQTGMSWADSLANMAMSGGNAALSGVLMGSGAMASTVRSAKEKGASDSQAMGAGIAAGFFEGLFEQYSIENLSWMAKSDPRSFLDVVKNLGKSILGEGSEELFTELANIAADTLIMGDLSDYNLGVQQYIAQGASEKEAKQHAAADLAVQAGLAFAGGALMGMGSAGAGMTYNAASNRYTAPRAVESGEFYNALQYGLAQGEDTDAGRLARELAGKDTAGNADVMLMLREAYDQQEEDAERRAEPRVNALLRDAALKRTEIAQQEAAAEPDAHRDEAAARAAMQAAEAAQETRSKPDRETALPKAETPNSAVQADISEQDRSIMEEYFKGDVDRATYERGYEVFKRLGELGMDYDEAVAHAGAYASTLGKKYEPALRVANARGLKQRKALQAAQSTPDVQAEVHYGENAQENTPEVLQNVYTLLAKKTGQAVQVSDALSDGRGREANGAFSQKMGAFFFSTQAGNRYETVAHELFEYGRAYNPEGMARAEHAMLGMLAKKNGFANDTNGIDQMISAYQKRYGGTYADAAGEMVNDALSGTFSEDGGVEQLVRWMSEDGGYTEQEKKTVLQTLADWLKKLVDSLQEYIASVGHGTAGAEAGARLQNAEQLRAQVLSELDKAVETRDTLAKKNAPASAEASDGGAVKYSINPGFEKAIDAWDGNTTNTSVYVGETSEALKSVGVKPGRIYWDFSKIKKILDKHSGMSREIIKKVPQIIESPVLVSLSSGSGNVQYDSRIAVFSDVTDDEGNTVLVALELLPRSRGGLHVDNIKIASAYGKNNVADTIHNGVILYLDPNKKRTNAWLRVNRLQLPLHVPSQYGSINKLTYVGDTVKVIDKNSFAGKLLDNFYDAGDTKFSLKVPVEQAGDLVAVHNLNEEKLEKTLQLGGFPMPSIAVTRADVGHSNFGDISLLFGKDSIDPGADRRNKVFSADAWTPTVPATEYEADSSANAHVQQRLNDLRGRVDDVFRRELDMAADTETLLNREGGEAGLLKWAEQKDGLKAAFLEDTGKPVQKIEKRVEKEKGYSENRAERYEQIAAMLGVDDPDDIGKMRLSDIRNEYGEHLENVFPGMTKTSMRMASILTQTQKYLKNRGGAIEYDTVTDEAAMREAVRSETDMDAYRGWLRELYAGIEGKSGVYNNKEYLTPSGNRRTFEQTHYPATLEGIVRAMSGQNGGKIQNVSSFLGVKTLRAQEAKSFGSIDEIRAEKGRIQNLSQEEFEQIEKDLNAEFYDVTQKILTTNPYIKNDIMAADHVGEVLTEIAEKRSITPRGIQKTFAQYHYEITPDMAEDAERLLYDISQMPTNMFEAKPMRAVGFDEVKAAIVPDSISANLRVELREHGIPVVEYPAGDEKARLNVLNNLDDVRFSLPGVETSSEEARRLAWENQQLAQQVEALRDEFKLTKGHRVSDRAIDLVAGRMLRETKSGYDRSALNEQLRGLFDYIANGENVVWDDVMDVAAGIARGVLSKSSEMDDTLYNEYKDMRDYFRTTKIRVTENVRAEIEATYGSYETFRRANFGRMALSTEDSTPLDALWGEISEKWPGMFDADTNELEQVFKVEEALDMVRPSYVNPYGLDMDGAAYELAQRMYEWYFTLPEVHTFADKQREKLVKTRIRMTEQRKTALEKQKARYEGRIRELREANAAQRKKASERMIRQRAVMLQSKREQALARRKRAKRSKHISRIKNNVWDLTKRLERPTDKKNIPEEMRGPILRFLNSIDFNTSREGTQAAEKWKNAAESIKLMLERAEAGKIDGYEGDPGLTVVINGLTDAKNGIASLGDATLDQLEDLDLIVRVLKGMVVKYGQTLANKKFKTAAALGNATIAELDARREHGTVKTMEKISDMLNEDMVNPMDWFTRMGGAAESVWKELRDGFNRRVWHLKDAQEFMEKTLDGVRAKELRQWTGDSVKAAEFQVSNGVMRLKPAQVMELYVLNQREQARKHLYGDGIRVAGYVKAGRKTVRQMKTYKVTPEQVAAITGTLTDKQRQIADAMQKYLSSTVAEWGNETSLSMYGYRKFTEENYWTIHVDETQTDTKDSTANQTGLYHIANMGASKPTSEKAKNVLMLDDAFDTFTRHVSDMATYNAWAEATKDAMRWYNYQDHETGETVQKSIQQAYGNAALRYFEKLMQDVNGITGDVGTAFGALDDKMMSKMKAAAVGANLRVIIQQPTAYMRAAAVLPPKYLATGLAHIRSGMKKAQQHSAISVWKDWGYFETAIGKNMRNVMVGDETVLEKTRNLMMKPAGYADSVTWGALWSACEAYVKDTQTDLDAGSEAFYTAVSEKMDEVVDRTQVVDTVLHRSHIMRNQDRISRAATAFMSEPMKSYNMVLTALRDVRDGKPGAKKALGRTLAAYALSAAATAAAAGLIDALRDDDEDKEFDEKYLDALRVNFVDNVIMVNNIPFVKDIFSMAQGYDVGRDDLAVFETATQLIQTLLKIREGESKTTWYKVSYSAAKLVSLGTGLGFNNILRDLRAFYDNVTEFKDPLHIHASITWQNRDMLKAIDVDDMKRAQDVLDVLWERKVAEYTAKGEEKPRDAAKSALKAAVTAEYKEAYIEAGSAGRAAIEEKLTALMTGGEALYDVEDIRKWLGDEYIAQKLGVSEETLKAFNAMLEETGADEDGRVSSVEALEAASRLGVSDSDKAALWKKYASERQKEKYDAAQQRGLGNAYLDILSAVGTNPKQEELYAYLRRGGYSDGQREALWEIVGGWKISYKEYGQKH